MKKITFITVLTSLFSFVFGVYWGLYSNNRLESSAQLNVLAEEGAFPEKFLSQFQKYTGIKIHVHSYSSDQEFQEGLKQADMDLIQVRDKHKQWVNETEISDYESPWQDEVSADFQKFKSDSSTQSFVPFAWFADIYLYNKGSFKPPDTLLNVPKSAKIGKAKSLDEIKSQLGNQDLVLTSSSLLAGFPLGDSVQFWQPREKTPLTVFLIGILKSSDAHKKAQVLIDYLLSVDGAKTYALTARKASTVDVMNLTDLPEPLKPMFLRQLQIDRLY